MNPSALYILNQPEPYRSILLQVQAVIEATIPDISLKYKYKIPYYYLNGKPFCYFNASHKKAFVDIGFARGQQLKNYLYVMEGANRSVVTSLRYKSLEEIDVPLLEAIFKAALLLYKK